MNHSHRLGWQALLVMIALAALSLTLFTGCARSGDSSDAGKKPGAVVLTEADADQVIAVSPGQMLEVVLGANPSTGYTWTIDSAPAFLTSEGDPEFSSEAATDVVGAGGKQTLEFSVTAAGKGSLELSYVRPWEKGTPPIKTFKAEIDSK